jgi:hypothetical protein
VWQPLSLPVLVLAVGCPFDGLGKACRCGLERVDGPVGAAEARAHGAGLLKKKKMMMIRNYNFGACVCGGCCDERIMGISLFAYPLLRWGNYYS